MSHTLCIHTKQAASYDYRIAFRLFEQLDSIDIPYLNAKKAIVIIDENVRKYHQQYLDATLFKSINRILELIVPSGEGSKNIHLFTEFVQEILASGVDRTTPLIAIGGGVTGDLAGFVAACVLRGIPLIHVPTTTLAMVDSSIGGKTGINDKSGKNLIGSFYQPKAILADTYLLSTLAERELLCGVSETIKHAVIAQPSLSDEILDWLEKKIIENADSWIAKSATIKANIVQEDTLENGKRALLNYGHTFGHAIEAASGYTILHGEAVFLGMMAAEFASAKYFDITRDADTKTFLGYYQKYLPPSISNLERLLPFVRKDKKNSSSHIRLILSKKKGQASIHEVDEPIVVDSFNFLNHRLQQLHFT